MEEGTVETISGTTATVRVERSAACKTCESRGACRMLGDKDMLLEIENDLQARAGDRVEIDVPTRTLLKLSVFVYLMPILMLIAGAYLGRAWAQATGGNPQNASLLGGMIAMGLSFYVLRRLDRRARGKKTYRPRMTRIIPNDRSLLPGDNRSTRTEDTCLPP